MRTVLRRVKRERRSLISVSSSRLVPLALLVLLLCAAAQGATTERVSVASDATQANSESLDPSISADGRYVAFSSSATNLVPGDNNGYADVFVHDRQTGLTERVSISNSGAQGDWDSTRPCLSPDGRYVAFHSSARNLVADDTNGSADVFVRDRETGQTERVSVAGDGTQGDGDSWSPAISSDGAYVVFCSSATNLVPDDTNDVEDVFVHDCQTGATERVSVASDGTQADDKVCGNSCVSADGRYVAFDSSAKNLVSDDTNWARDVFVHDRATGQTTRVSVSSTGAQTTWGTSGNPSITADGRFVAFSSTADNLVDEDTSIRGDVFVHDMETGQTERVSVASDGTEGDGPSGTARISPDGRYVAFLSQANNLVPGDATDTSDVFIHDRTTGMTELVSVATDGAQANDLPYHQGGLSTSDLGRCVAFVSFATNLVPADTNGWVDIFVRDRSEVYFDDVSTWYWAYDEVTACVDAGIVGGYEDGLYHPEWAVTRDQMAVYISRALAGGDDNVPEFTGPPTFPDVPSDPEPFWALGYVEYAVAQNVVAGYDDDLYHPEYEVTRDQMAVYVARALVAPTGEAALADYVPPAPRNFPDVPSTGYGDDGTDPFWAYKHIEYCVEHGVVQGYDDGYYHPDYVVTRDQMAVYITRAFELEY